jgi:hypothetical protein
VSYHVLGIRHHGPGSAASLVEALEQLQPDSVLLEGPPDADGLLPLATHAEMEPPVAILIYRAEGGRGGAYFPFAAFSPEWNALRWALQRGVPVRFMDLPQTHQFALKDDDRGSGDPLGALARAAGFEDDENWWEWVVEQRRSGEVFPGILEAMGEVRRELGSRSRIEALREAYMRKTMRQERKAGRQRIAVVCGAWHAPVLEEGSAKADDALLKGLPKVKVEAAWVPWTYDRLAYSSGYGAGVRSPEYYHLLWEHPGELVATRWMVAAAQLLRDQDLSASPASAVDAVRLAQGLAALRGREQVGLAELLEAAEAVLCNGSDMPLRLVKRKLVVGERLGHIPDDSPQVPLARDLAARQRRLRLAPEASARMLELDLRKPNDRERSLLLHRLLLLEIRWGEAAEARGLGTFRETWALQWRPELSLAVVQAAPWGNTVEEAANAFAAHRASEAKSLGELTELADAVLLADLPEGLSAVLSELQARSALASDPGQLLESLPPFSRILRYPDVRQTDSEMLRGLVDSLVERIGVGLPLACRGMNDEGAELMLGRLLPAHQALLTLNESAWLDVWKRALVGVADIADVHGLVAGRACWILTDLRFWDHEEAARRLGLALSQATDPAHAAAFVEGFLRNNGELLVHAPELFAILDDWISGLVPERFQETLPLLRRTFATFPAGVRANLGANLGRGLQRIQVAATLDPDRAALVLPVVRQLLGIRLDG